MGIVGRTVDGGCSTQYALGCTRRGRIVEVQEWKLALRFEDMLLRARRRREGRDQQAQLCSHRSNVAFWSSRIVSFVVRDVLLQASDQGFCHRRHAIRRRSESVW